MILDRIQSASPVQVKSREAREYSDWELNLVVIRPNANDGAGTATFELVPHDYDIGDSLYSRARIVNVNDLTALAARRPGVLAAINAIAAAVAGHVDSEGS